jgi:hypothetical protein
MAFSKDRLGIGNNLSTPEQSVTYVSGSDMQGMGTKLGTGGWGDPWLKMQLAHLPLNGFSTQTTSATTSSAGEAGGLSRRTINSTPRHPTTRILNSGK